jgi:ribose transport system permease protein
VLGVQHPILICLVLVAIGDLLLRKSRFLRQNYYIGGSEKAAILSGINVNRMKIFNYALTGVLAAVAGMITASRFGNVSVTLGKNLELQVITAVIIGGASLQGGEGTVLGALLGSLLMAMIVTAINIFHVDIYWNTFIIGTTLLVAVLIDVVSKKKRSAV